MKILMLLEGDFPPDIRVENECNSLLNQGHEVHVACYTFQNKPLKEKLNGINIHRKAISKFIYKSSVGALKLPFYFNFWRSFLSKIMAFEQFDVIHIHDLPLSKVGVEAKKKYNIKLVVDLHENWPAAIEGALHTQKLLGRILSSNKQWRNYEKNILKEADLIVTVIEEMKERISKLGIDKNRIVVTPNTLNEEQFPHSNNQPDANYITLIYSGGINIHRGLQVAINGLKKAVAKFPNIRLWILGSGTYSRYLEKLTEELDLKENVVFWGWKKQNEISDYVAMSDITLIPHLRSEQTDNSSPNKLYQYMYVNKPILASDCKSIKRIIQENNAGIVYQSDSSADFSEKLLQIIDKEVLNKSSSTLQKSFNKANLWNNTVTALINKYNQLT